MEIPRALTRAVCTLILSHGLVACDASISDNAEQETTANTASTEPGAGAGAGPGTDAGTPSSPGGQPSDCQSSCGDRVCGVDACGVSCGVCPSGSLCDDAGQCECQPACEGKSCGGDGCGGICGTCEGVQSCSDAGQCAWPDLCGGWTGIQGVGTRWTYSYTESDGSSSTEVTDIDGQWITFVTESTTYSGDFTVKSTTTLDYRCDEEGLWLLGSNSNNVTTGPDYSNTSPSSISYGDGYLAIPAGLEVGDSWTASVQGSSTYGGESTSFSYTQSHSVAAAETVTVPAGTFETLKINVDGNNASWSWWLAPGVGSVKASGSALSSYTP